MLQQLLDIAPIDGPYRRHHQFGRILKDTMSENFGVVKKQLNDSVVVVKDSVNDSIAVGNDAVNDSLSSMNVVADSMSNQAGGSSMLFWSIIVVLFALALCLSFALMYRRRRLSV